MKTVFIGGSRRVSRLNEQIRRRLDDMVKRNFRIIVGDANGADRAMQRQLSEWDYRAVTVYYVGDRPRNNEGAWATQRIETPLKRPGFEFYTVKDRQMATDAECGLMLWDGKSRGTLANVERLVQAQKPVAVYVAPVRRFVSILNEEDLRLLQASNGMRQAGTERSSTSLQEELRLDLRKPLGRKTRRRNTR